MSDFFEKIDNDKQERFDERVCRAICKGLGITSVMQSYLANEVRDVNNPVEGWSADVLSDQLCCPIVFRAVKDYFIEQKNTFPDPLWLMSHRIDGRKCRSLYDKLWIETKERFGDVYVACVFRPKWADSLVTIHDYTPACQTNPGASLAVKGGAMFWNIGDRIIFVQYLQDLLTVLSSNWQPEILTRQ